MHISLYTYYFVKYTVSAEYYLMNIITKFPCT